METSNPTETDQLPAPATRTSLWQLVGLLALTFVLGGAAGYLIWARPLESKLAEAQQAVIDAQTAAAVAQQPGNNQPAEGAQPAQEATPEVRRYPIPVDDDPFLGPADAPITIIEFSDYECPYCQKWHIEVLPRLIEKYGDQMRLVYRDFPLVGMHSNAAPAAEAANCAGDQDKYWEFQELLFNGEMALTRKTYEAYAQQLKLKTDEFNECLDDRRYQQEVEADYNYAGKLGVQSTPTFFINGLAVIGAQPFEVFERIIDMELAGEIP
jgi:protein-disulfide isomerase